MLVALGVVMTTAVTSASPAHAANSPMSCPPDTWDEVYQVGGSWYGSIGSAVGKYNASGNPSTLSYALSVTETRSTTVSAGAEMSASWGIATVKANVGVAITATTNRG
jgi:hypothetical protein